MIVVAAILSAHIHLDADVPVRYCPSSTCDFVSVELGETLNNVRVVIHEVADLDRLVDVLAVARADLAARQSRAAA